MKHEFWHERWQKNEIGFHESETNAALLHQWSLLNVNKGDEVFVPLCGKSNDMVWLAEQGYRVLGAELSPIACAAFFNEHNLKPVIREDGRFRIYAGGPYRIFCGDFFALTTTDLTNVRAVYDRAALVALPPEMRARYAEALRLRLPVFNMLLVSFEYDQSKMPGPPHAVLEEEVRRLYAGQQSAKGPLIVDLARTTGRQPAPSRLQERGMDWIAETVFHIHG